MSANPNRVGWYGQTASDAGAFVAKAAGAAKPSGSMLGRVGAAVSAVKLGARLAPGAWRLLKRYPIASAVGLAGLVWVLYSMRAARGWTADR